MPEIKKGNNSAKNVGGVTSFNICIKALQALHDAPPLRLHQVK